MKEIKIYTDGSCLGNPGEGGWGAIIQHNDEEKILKGGEEYTTNNRMEMTGIIAALSWVKKNIVTNHSEEKFTIHIFSDSRLIIETLTKNWKKKMNTDLWAEMDDAMSDLVHQKVKITWNWVKGHSTNILNQRVDKIAVAESTKLKNRR